MALRGMSVLKVMGKGRSKVFNDPRSKATQLRAFFKITRVCYYISISAKIYFKIISCLSVSL